MVEIKTIKSKQGSIALLFGVRFITLLQKKLHIENLEQIGDRMISPTFEDVASILFCAHENACFYQRKDLTVDSVDFMLFLLDEIGTKRAVDIIAEGMQETMNVQGGGGEKKKVARA